VGIDNDEKAINKCKKKIAKLDNVRIFLEDAEKTHFQDAEFDIATMIGTFCNLGETKSKVLLETKRVLKDNGILILTIYNENALEERLKLYKKLGHYNFSKKATEQ
jgi:ubiquinone/menaquinone biosynthesis C-methylase UbiE